MIVSAKLSVKKRRAKNVKEMLKNSRKQYIFAFFRAYLKKARGFKALVINKLAPKAFIQAANLILQSHYFLE